MPRNEDGEFELILGNRQLISVFFIVVILLGVFFAMGYIVGRNSSPVGAPRNRLAWQPETQAVAAERLRPRRETSGAGGRRKETRPRKRLRSPRKPLRSKLPRQARSASEPVAPHREGVRPRARPPTEPESGKTYLQLSAIDHDKAEIMVELLRKKSFRAIAAEIPEKPGVFRVLVGPCRCGHRQDARRPAKRELPG